MNFFAKIILEVLKMPSMYVARLLCVAILITPPSIYLMISATTIAAVLMGRGGAGVYLEIYCKTNPCKINRLQTHTSVKIFLFRKGTYFVKVPARFD